MAQVSPQIQGAGAPTNPCYNGGQQYLDTTNHVLYNCSVPGQNWVNIGIGNLTNASGVSVSGAVTAGHVATFVNSSTIQDGGTGGGITNSAGANVVMKSDGTNAVASSISDNATTVTTTDTGGIVAPQLTAGSSGVQGTVTLFGTSNSGTIKSAGNSTELDISATTFRIGTGGSNVTLTGGGGNTTIAATAGVVLSPGVSTTVSTGPFGFSGGKGQHFTTQAANNDHAGTCTAASATTCTVTFTTAYTSAPACVATDATNITTLKVTPSTTSLVITTTSSTSDVFDYVCVGNPN
jgi:hypothetical protein